jgi:hypothetical protein
MTSNLRRQLLENLRDDFQSTLLIEVPLTAVRYALAHRRLTPARDFGIAIGTSALESVTHSVISNLSQFSLLSALPPSPSFKRRLVIQIGSRMTASVLTAALFRQPFSVPTYVISPIVGALWTGAYAIMQDREEGNAFVAEYAPKMLPLLQRVRELQDERQPTAR